jgi:hypothetical protein
MLLQMRKHDGTVEEIEVLRSGFAREIATSSTGMPNADGTNNSSNRRQYASCRVFHFWMTPDGFSSSVRIHVGEVFYGNIGSDERLDFAVAGPAVNEVSRIVSMCPSVDRDVLASSDFVAALSGSDRTRFASAGRFALRGVRRPQEIVHARSRYARNSLLKRLDCEPFRHPFPRKISL